jgi:alanyl-tRNA synthetase
MATRRLYYDDSFQQEFDARVLRCEPLPIENGSGAPIWGAVLDSTAFYPTSGGQPHDTGKLGEANVLDVEDEGDEVVHVVDRDLPDGEIAGCVNWPRRFDHMQQHTGQHLLSAMLQERFGLPTVSFHLGEEICTIDVRGRQPDEDALEGAERAANKIIFEDRNVIVRYGTQEQLAEMGIRKEVQREGILRAIEIEGADLQPCGGTHVKRTGQIGVLLVRSCTKIRQDWRIEFLCGGRAEHAARRDFRLLRSTAEFLSCAHGEIANSVARAIEERDTHFKSARNWLLRLADAEAQMAVQAAQPDRAGLRVVARVVEGVPVEFAGAFASAVAQQQKAIALVGHAESRQIFFSQHASSQREMNALLKRVVAEIGGKGGGSRDSARGALSDAQRVKEAIDFAAKLLSTQS